MEPGKRFSATAGDAPGDLQSWSKMCERRKALLSRVGPARGNSYRTRISFPWPVKPGTMGAINTVSDDQFRACLHFIPGCPCHPRSACAPSQGNRRVGSASISHRLFGAFDRAPNLVDRGLAAPRATLWTLSPALALVPIVVMPVACILFVGGVLTPNPLSISLRLRPFDPARPGFIGITRHPILWSFSLWAASHIAPNGNVVAVSLFGGLALYALGGMWLADRRARLRLTPAIWAQFAAKTSVWPFGAQISGRAEFPKFGELLPALVLGLSLYALVLLRGHEWLIGVAPLDAL